MNSLINLVNSLINLMNSLINNFGINSRLSVDYVFVIFIIIHVDPKIILINFMFNLINHVFRNLNIIHILKFVVIN